MISNKNYLEAAELLNSNVRAWTISTQAALRNNIRSMSSKGRGELLRMTHEYYRAHGQINRVSFRFPKHGVYFAKGGRRGYRSKNGVVYKVTPGPFKRHPKDWFNSTLEERIPILADKLGESMANAAVNATNVKIH